MPRLARSPPGIPQLPETSALSNRKTVEALTEVPGTTCINCHQALINPFGFAFEHYDVAGDRINRRTILRGTTGLALALPFFEAFRSRPARADEAVVPPFAVFMKQANGVATV